MATPFASSIARRWPTFATALPTAHPTRLPKPQRIHLRAGLCVRLSLAAAPAHRLAREFQPASEKSLAIRHSFFLPIRYNFCVVSCGVSLRLTPACRDECTSVSASTVSYLRSGDLLAKN